MTYGGTAPTVTPSYSGFVNGDTAASLTTQPTCSTTATSSTPVGTDTGADTCSGAVDPNYSFTYVAGNVTVNKATPVITWATPAAITYGTTLSSTQLNATASVPGTFVYSPAAGTTPAGGTDTSRSPSLPPTRRITIRQRPPSPLRWRISLSPHPPVLPPRPPSRPVNPQPTL